MAVDRGFWMTLAAERQAEIDRLKAALKPFAELSALLPPDVIPDHWPVRVSKVCAAGDMITVGHLRAAARVLEQHMRQSDS
jgi:hypothetical protein